MAETTMTRRLSRSTLRPISQKLLPRTFPVSGRLPWGRRRTKGGPDKISGRVEEVRFGQRLRQPGVKRPQDTPAHGHQVRGEGDLHRLAGQQAQLLLHLRGLAVLRHLVGPEAVIDLAERRVANESPAAGAARPGFAVGNHRVEAESTYSAPEAPTPG